MKPSNKSPSAPTQSALDSKRTDNALIPGQVPRSDQPNIELTGTRMNKPTIVEGLAYHDDQPCDGIDDEHHTSSAFLKDIGTGRKGLLPPNPTYDKTWPPLPEEVKGIDARFFRKPDFVTDGSNNDEFNNNFLTKANALGWIHRRGNLNKLGRLLAGGLIGATGLGACFLAGKYTRIFQHEIGFCTDIDEGVHLLLPGHHCEFNPSHGPTMTHAITKDYIKFRQRAHIIRVHPGEYVVAKINDQYQLLAPGDNHSVGVHMFDDPKFEYVSRVKQTEPAILAGPINIITVPPGMLAKIMIQNKPYLLFEGTHQITSGLLEFGQRIMSIEDMQEQKNVAKSGVQRAAVPTVGFSNLKDTFLYHLIGKVYVQPGQVIGIQVNRRAVFLDAPGDYYFYSDQILMSDSISELTPRFQFSSLMRVFIKENEFGIVQRQTGQLELLKNGIHVIEMPNKFLASITKTVQYGVYADQKGLTMDPMDVVYSFTCAWRIVDPFKAYLVGSQTKKVDKDNKEIKEQPTDASIFDAIQQKVVSSATRTMQEIVRRLLFKDTMQLSRMSTADVAEIKDPAREGADQPGSVKTQFKIVSTESIQTMAKTMLDIMGVEIIVGEFGLSKLDLANQKEQDELNKSAFEVARGKAMLVTAETNRKIEENNKVLAEIKAKTEVSQNLIRAEAANKVAELNAIAKATQQKIQAEANAEQKAIEAKSNAANVSIQAKAQAEELTTIADAKAHQIKIMGEAEAGAIKAKGEAEGFAADQYKDRIHLQMMEQVANLFKGTNLTIMDSQQGALGVLLQQVVGKLASHVPADK